jgi:hypothetical protein
MNRLEAALLDVCGFLESRRIPHMVIGGYANLHWGKPRLTEDLDIKVQVEESAWQELIGALGARYRLLSNEPLEFVRQTRVIPIATPTGVRVDLIVAELPYEFAAIRRAVPLGIGAARIPLCSAEDLILHKIISERSRDREDVEGIIVASGSTLDRAYLEPILGELARGLERPELLEFYRAALRKAGFESPPAATPDSETDRG